MKEQFVFKLEHLICVAAWEATEGFWAGKKSWLLSTLGQQWTVYKIGSKSQEIESRRKV